MRRTRPLAVFSHIPRASGIVQARRYRQVRGIQRATASRKGEPRGDIVRQSIDADIRDGTGYNEIHLHLRSACSIATRMIIGAGV
jgi:hypothetical protein